jgi:sensitive to high expression protein 9
MKPLLQHASRSLTAGFASVASSSRLAGEFNRVSTCLRCQYRAASTTVRSQNRAQWSSNIPTKWSQRSFSSSSRWMEERRSSQPIPMPPPTTEPRSTPDGGVEDRLSEIVASFERQERLQKELDAQIKKQSSEQSAQPESATLLEQPPAPQVQERVRDDAASTTEKNDVADNIRRVPEEHLPSHRERQRWDFSKRFSEIMDDVLPKLAVVTQKVNTYTGTDYSGVEALRREIKEQGASIVLNVFALANSVQRTSSGLAEPPSTPPNNR